MERRHLLKALLAGLAIAGTSPAILGATKTTTKKTTAKAVTSKASAKTKTGTTKASAVSKKTVIKKAGKPKIQVVRTLSLDVLNTGEKGRSIPYYVDGRYQRDALGELNRLLRDWRNDRVHTIDPQLLDTLHRLQQATGSTKPFEVISAYRSPQTNSALAEQSVYRGVARHSLHVDGKAVDVSLPGVQLSQLHRAALQLKRGGVGYYPGSGFVHVDTGKVRSWYG
jgi:uncharacterized protein YcbK (DUF882 family)